MRFRGHEKRCHYEIQYSVITSDGLLSHQQRFPNIQIIVIQNFVFVSSVSIKRVDSILKGSVPFYVLFVL